MFAIQTDVLILSATDENTTIYTVVTGGTDQLVRLWRIYSLRDFKSTGSSRLIPNGPLVCLVVFFLFEMLINKDLVIEFCLFSSFVSYLFLGQEHLCGNSTVIGTSTMNAECVLTISAHGSSVTGVK